MKNGCVTHLSSVTELDKDKRGIETSTLMLSIAVFIVSSPPEVTLASNLLKPCIEAFKTAWNAKDVQVCLTWWAQAFQLELL